MAGIYAFKSPPVPMVASGGVGFFATPRTAKNIKWGSVRETKPAIAKPGAVRAVSFTPEALQAVIAKATADAVALATAALRAEMQQALNAKPAKASPKLTMAGQSDRSLRNQIDTVKAFKKAGYGNVTPHVDVRTFNRWMADNRRPIEGSKSLTVGNLRLFHVSQTREISSEEKAKNVEQQKAAIDRHTAKNKGKTATVHHLPQ
jgi:hypothetical protein